MLLHKFFDARGFSVDVALMVLIMAVLIEIFKDNKVQDWLERCCFDKFETSERYRSQELELHELELALDDMKA